MIWLCRWNIVSSPFQRPGNCPAEKGLYYYGIKNMKKYTFRHDAVDGHCLFSITLPAFFMAALLAGSFLGCAEKQDCFKDADCAWGKFCRSGFCISECRFDVDCEFPGMVCVQHRGYCRYPDAGVNDDSGVMDGATTPQWTLQYGI
jgi:hypothetical protein